MLLRHDRARTAIAILLDVAFHAGQGPATGAGDIAERIGATRRGIEPVLQALSRAGLLESLRGPGGGYRLGQPAARITLATAIAAVAEPSAEPATTGRLQAAVVAPLWRELDQTLRETLAALSLDDLLKRAAAAGLKRPRAEVLDFVI